MAPSVGFSCKRISFDVVVLPQPDSPMTPSVSPAPIAKLMPSTAFTQAIFLRGNNPTVTGKCLTRPSSSSRGGIGLPFGIGQLRLRTPTARRPTSFDDHLGRRFAGAARE